MILPATDASLRAYASSKNLTPHAPRWSYLSGPVEFNLARVLQSEIEFQKSIGSLKWDLNLRYDFNVSGLFSLIDRQVPFNKLDRYEIQEFVETYSR